MEDKEAIEILKNYHNGYFGYKIDDVHEAHNLAIKALEKAERPQGEWLYNDKLNMYYCKDCGLLEPFTKEEIEEGCKLPNFCQQCGADMRKGGAE